MGRAYNIDVGRLAGQKEICKSKAQSNQSLHKEMIPIVPFSFSGMMDKENID